MSWNPSLIDGPIPIYQILGLDLNGLPILGPLLPVYNLNVAPQVYNASLAPYVVEPSTPQRVFLNDNPSHRTMTICLSFASEAQAKLMLPSYWVTGS